MIGCMKKLLLIPLLSLLIIFGFAFIPEPKAEQPTTTHPAPLPEPELFITHPEVPQLHELVNQERVKAGLSPLTIDERLTASSAAKCADMVAKNYWGHKSPDGS